MARTSPSTSGALGAVVIGLALAACNLSSGIGTPCAATDECDPGLQCFDQVCQPGCRRHPDCGDGLRCDEGTCVAALGQDGAACLAETECASGFSCVLAQADPDGDGYLAASCRTDHPGAGRGAACDRDESCRDGTCELGHCV